MYIFRALFGLGACIRQPHWPLGWGGGEVGFRVSSLLLRADGRFPV